ncbi:hypothetical protein TRVL_04669 [Trypanosoma vivax]|nr:hypothetical protein TRVL_04669 [Trypanosoma vivax]
MCSLASWLSISFTALLAGYCRLIRCSECLFAWRGAATELLCFHRATTARCAKQFFLVLLLSPPSSHVSSAQRAERATQPQATRKNTPWRNFARNYFVCRRVASSAARQADVAARLRVRNATSECSPGCMAPRCETTCEWCRVSSVWLLVLLRMAWEAHRADPLRELLFHSPPFCFFHFNTSHFA